MSVGFGVGDILLAISKCKDIYTSFASEYESAPRRVQELVDTSRYLITVFDDVTAVGKADGVPEALQRTFLGKLEECNDFIRGYRALKRNYLAEHRSSSISDRMRGHWEMTWQTGRYAFDGRRAQELRDALSLETTKLLLFLVTSMRNRANDSTSLTTSSHHHPPGYDPTWIEHLFARMRSINNRYEREMSASAQRAMLTGSAHEPDLSGVNAEMRSVWNDFCARAGLPALSSTPLLEPNWRSVINATTPSVHYNLPWPRPRPPYPPGRADTLQSDYDPGSVGTSPSNSTVPSVHPSSGAFTQPTASNTTTPLGIINWDTSAPYQGPFHSAPSPAFHQATAYVTLIDDGFTKVIKLAGWHIDRSGHRPKIVWKAEKPPGVLEHTIPRDVFPETLHSSHQKPLHVTFPIPKHDDEEHRLVWTPSVDYNDPYASPYASAPGRSPSTRHYDDLLPEYLFTNPHALRTFQSDVRDRELLERGTFDTDVIWTDRTDHHHHHTDRRESYSQDLKLWRTRPGPGGWHDGEAQGQGQGSGVGGRYSLSFNVTNCKPFSNTHVECELSRFVPTARTGGSGGRGQHVVYLDFASGGGERGDSMSSTAAATDELSVGGSASVGHQPGGAGMPPPPPPPPAKKKRGLSDIWRRSSQVQVQTHAPEKQARSKRASFTSQKSVQLVAGDDFFANLRYLAVEFSDVEDEREHVVETGKQAADRFRKLFDHARREEAKNQSPFMLPNPRFPTWHLDLGESAVPPPDQEELHRRSASREVSPASAPSPTQAVTLESNRARTPSDLLGLPHRGGPFGSPSPPDGHWDR